MLYPEGTLDLTVWKDYCSKLSAESAVNSGLLHALYIKRFSTEVERLLPLLAESDKEEALLIAKSFDYAAPAEIRQTDDTNKEMC